MSINIQFDQDALRPIIQLVVDEALDRLHEERAKLNGRLAYTEPEAAALLGVRPHVLRDCRLRGEIHGSRVGKSILYEADELRAFLRRQRQS